MMINTSTAFHAKYGFCGLGSTVKDSGLDFMMV